MRALVRTRLGKLAIAAAAALSIGGGVVAEQAVVSPAPANAYESHYLYGSWYVYGGSGGTWYHCFRTFSGGYVCYKVS